MIIIFYHSLFSKNIPFYPPLTAQPSIHKKIYNIHSLNTKNPENPIHLFILHSLSSRQNEKIKLSTETAPILRNNGESLRSQSLKDDKWRMTRERASLSVLKDEFRRARSVINKVLPRSFRER